MLQFDGGQAQTSDNFPPWPSNLSPSTGPEVLPGLAILGPSMQGVGVLVSIYNNLVDLQLALRDPAGGGGIGWKPGTIIQGVYPAQFAFPKAIGFRVRTHNTGSGQIAQVIGQVWETMDGPFPLAPLGSNLATLSAGGSFGGGGQGSVTGDIVFSAGAIRTGAVLCDGSHYNSVVDPTFANLFALIGTTFGGTGSNDFAVPDFRGRQPVGKGPNGNVAAIGQTEPGTAVGARSPYHTHTVTDPTHMHNIGYGPTSGGGTTGFPAQGDNAITSSIATPAASTGITVGPGGGPNDTPAYMVMNAFIVK